MAVGNTIFNRSASLIVGIEGQEGIDFSNLRITFQVAKGSESNTNTSKITVFNLNKDSRSFIEVEQERLVLILKAGYTPKGSEKPIEEIIFQGDVAKATNVLNGSDWQTSFEVGDGEKALIEKHIDKGFAKGVKLSTAIEDAAKALGKPISVIKGLKDKVFKNGLTLSGGAKEVLDNLTSEAGVEWSIQDGEVVILPPRQGDGEDAFLVSRKTGMIGSPVKRKEGVDVMTTLNGAFRPGRSFQIESKFIEGFLRVRKVTHSGDTHEGSWESKVEAVYEQR